MSRRSQLTDDGNPCYYGRNLRKKLQKNNLSLRDRDLRELVHGMLRLLFSENHQGFIFDHRMEPGQFVIGGKETFVHGIEPQRRVLYCVHGVTLLPEHHIGSAEQESVIPCIEKLKSRCVLCSDQGQNLRQIGVLCIVFYSKHSAITLHRNPVITSSSSHMVYRVNR